MHQLSLSDEMTMGFLAIDKDVDESPNRESSVISVPDYIHTQNLKRVWKAFAILRSPPEKCTLPRHEMSLMYASQYLTLAAVTTLNMTLLCP